MDYASFSLGFGLGYLASFIPWRRARPENRPDLFDVLERGQHHKTFAADDITRAAEERLRRARERRNA